MENWGAILPGAGADATAGVKGDFSDVLFPFLVLHRFLRAVGMVIGGKRLRK
jgi:hypothetical protein